jgi:uncharacterized protein YybS (DUF2232 family)
MSGTSPPPPRRVRFDVRRLSGLFRTRMGRLVLVSYLALLGAEVLAIVGSCDSRLSWLWPLCR